jgi:hypothetical protein
MESELRQTLISAKARENNPATRSGV